MILQGSQFFWYIITGDRDLEWVPKHLLCHRGFPGGSDGKESACSVEDLGLILGREDPLEKGMAIHCSILAWRIPWTWLYFVDQLSEFSNNSFIKL